MFDVFSKRRLRCVFKVLFLMYFQSDVYDAFLAVAKSDAIHGANRRLLRPLQSAKVFRTGKF
jgi:hypothetical protein